ncbi:hypothetical protein KVT40_001926 [Elsinoe batatas]|uniref:Uncharacterized protein n=1 Tax=Elsinoe batatas TaxID=2601811 RepID=A0A8K0L6W2_9PEZI|nr:hypothetical protein KVT40_001926 [Elsinoe batatas]
MSAINGRTAATAVRMGGQRVVNQDDTPFDPPNLKIPTRREIYEGTAKYQRIGNTTVYDRKYYEKGRIYILDDPHGFARNTDVMMDDFVLNSNPHTLKCDQIRHFFTTRTNYFVEDVSEHFTELEFMTFWDVEREKWDKEELIIIYFHGRAGENGPDYQWKFTNGGMNTTINAYNFIKKLCGFGIDTMLILECYLPTRFQARAGLSRTATRRGTMIEVISNGQTGQGLNIDDYRTNVFTQGLISKLNDVVRDDYTLHPQVPHESFSIPELLADCAFDSNPYRLWLTKTRDMKIQRKNDFQTFRLRIDPDYPRERSKLAFCRDTIQDSKKQRELELAQAAAQARLARLNTRKDGSNGDDGDTEHSLILRDQIQAQQEASEGQQRHWAH